MSGGFRYGARAPGRTRQPGGPRLRPGPLPQHPNATRRAEGWYCSVVTAATPDQVPGLADLDRLDAVFGALAHHTRRAILVTLLAHGGSQTSGKIAGRMDHSWQTASRHLRQLEEAGLISVDLQGRERIYTLNDAFMTQVLRDWIERFSASAR